MYILNIFGQVNVIDFPGSNSLDYHAKTFSICGAMNNLIVVILPFTGDVSALVSEEVAKVFQVIPFVLNTYKKKNLENIKNHELYDSSLILCIHHQTHGGTDKGM